MSIALVALLLLSLPVLAITLRSHLQKKYPVSGSLISSSGTVDAPLAPKGSVIIDGELWLARSANGATIPAQTSIKVVGFDDHHLLVTQA
jgi:membrane-bound ClpP family serine protease